MTIKVKITRSENAAYFKKEIGDVVTVPLEEYVAAVVASEIGNAHVEACKAQAVAARTYAYPYYSNGKTITDASSTHQAYRAPRFNSTLYPNPCEAAAATAGQVLTYNGSVIGTCSYSASNGGRTVSSEERWGGKRAWLIAQDDPWDAAAGTGKSGHGVGMSQRGAKYAAGIGVKYDAILAFYYPGTTLSAATSIAIFPANIGEETVDEDTNETEDKKMIKANDLIEKVKLPLNEGWGYIWGAAGETWTQAKQNAATREQTKKWGQRWVGKRVVDCSGLLYWAFKQLGGSIYHGSNTMFKSYTTQSGTLKSGARSDGKALLPGTAVFQYNTADGYHHVGLYIGNGVVIESKGTYYGVVTSAPSNWSHWGELKGVDYSETKEEEIKMDTILYTATVTTTSGSLNMRKSPKTGAIITRLERNSTVDVYKEQDGWMFVKQGKYEGWVSGEYLTKNTTNQAVDEKTEDEILDTAEISIVITDSEGNTFKPVGRFTVDMVVSTEGGEIPV